MPVIKRSEAEQKSAEAHGPDFQEILARGIRLIETFNAAKRSMTLSELARDAEVTRATARRTLYTLERLGFVQSEGRLFSLTPKILTLAASYLVSNPITTVMQPVMDRISDHTREVCSAALLDGNNVVFVARSSPTRVFSTGLELGYRLPAFSSSVGRVLLGRYNDEELEEWLEKHELAATTPHTVVDKKLLKAIIVTDRRQGYSVVDQEAEAGFRSIAVPVRRVDGTIAAAMNIGAHIDRVSVGQMIDGFLPLLKKGAEEIQSLLL